MSPLKKDSPEIDLVHRTLEWLGKIKDEEFPFGDETSIVLYDLGM
jgi:hypothetical protein